MIRRYFPNRGYIINGWYYVKNFVQTSILLLLFFIILNFAYRSCGAVFSSKIPLDFFESFLYIMLISIAAFIYIYLFKDSIRTLKKIWSYYKKSSSLRGFCSLVFLDLPDYELFPFVFFTHFFVNIIWEGLDLRYINLINRLPGYMTNPPLHLSFCVGYILLNLLVLYGFLWGVSYYLKGKFLSKIWLLFILFLTTLIFFFRVFFVGTLFCISSVVSYYNQGLSLIMVERLPISVFFFYCSAFLIFLIVFELRFFFMDSDKIFFWKILK